MSKPGLVLVICPSYEDAVDAYLSFEEYLDHICTQQIVRSDRFSNTIDTDDNYRYCFIPYQFEDLFDDDRPDKVQMGDFFKGISEYLCSVGLYEDDGGFDEFMNVPFY